MILLKRAKSANLYICQYLILIHLHMHSFIAVRKKGDHDEYSRYFLYCSMKLYIVAVHQNHLDEAILIDASMYSYIEE